MARAKPDILEWVRERGQLGFFEWHSNVYMLKNITPLHLLAEQADDPELVLAAAMALDLCVLDMAAHTQAGCYTAPRGRTYKKDKLSSLDEDTFGSAKFLFDDTTADYQSETDGGATFLAAGTRYRPPQLLVDIAIDDQESVVRERHGVFLDTNAPLEDAPVAPYGKDFADRANLPFWWSLGGLGLWQMARTGLAQATEHKLWDTELFAQVKLIAAINDNDPERCGSGCTSSTRSSTSVSSARPTRTPIATARSAWPACSTIASARCATRCTSGRPPSTRTRWCSPPPADRRRR
jgi:hypothetical protein